MNNQALRTIWLLAGGVLLVSAVVASLWGLRVMTGMLVGGIWNLVSLWCLAKCLGAWLGPEPSAQRAFAWLLTKFPLLYLLAFGIFRTSSVSLIGFSVGFTVVLVVMMTSLAARPINFAKQNLYGY